MRQPAKEPTPRHLQPNWWLGNGDASPGFDMPPMADREALKPGDIVHLPMESPDKLGFVVAVVVGRYDGGDFWGEVIDPPPEFPRVRVGDTLDFQTCNVIDIELYEEVTAPGVPMDGDSAAVH